VWQELHKHKQTRNTKIDKDTDRKKKNDKTLANTLNLSSSSFIVGVSLYLICILSLSLSHTHTLTLTFSFTLSKLSHIVTFVSVTFSLSIYLSISSCFDVSWFECIKYFLCMSECILCLCSFIVPIDSTHEVF